MTFRTGNRSRKPLRIILFFSVLLMIVSSYSNTLESPPFLDDFGMFIYPRSLHLQKITLASLLGLSGLPGGLARFLPTVTFAINNYFFGYGGLTYFHVVNILIHLLTFLAVFWLVREILSAAKGPRGDEIPEDLAGLFPLCIGALWALSPVQTSAVTYLVQRIASMETLFFTLSAACFLRARLESKTQARSAPLFYILCVLAGLCAGVSKQNAAMLPVILAVIDIWFFDSAWIKRTWSFFRKTGWKIRAATVAAILWCLQYSFFTILPKLLIGYNARNFTMGQRLLTEARVVVWYMSLMLWPVPSRLSMEHHITISTSLFSPFTTIASILFIGFLILSAIRFRKRYPVITFGIVWYFLNLIIESTILPLELVFEHRLYAPSIGFYLAFGTFFTICWRKTAKRLPEAEFSKAVCCLFLVSASVFTLLTFTRNCAWKDRLTIHEDAVEKSPDSPRANADLAATLGELKHYKEAIKYAEKAIALGKPGDEQDVIAQNDISIALMEMGKNDEAIKRDEKFIKRNFNGMTVDTLPNLCLDASSACIGANRPKDAYKWILRALMYMQTANLKLDSQYAKGLVEQALVQLFSRYTPQEAAPGIAARLHGGKPSAEFLAAMVFKAHNEQQYAREIFEQEHAKNPDDLLVEQQLLKFQKEDAQNLAQKKRWNVFQKYVRSPFSRFDFDMAVAYLVQKDQLPGFFEKIGERRVDAALKICPDSREALLLKAWYLYSDNDAGGAVKAARQVLAKDPDNANTWLALGFFLGKTTDIKGAVSAFHKVLELYPGYPERLIVEQLCKQLQLKAVTIKSASITK